jgi:hypothetical protein
LERLQARGENRLYPSSLATNPAAELELPRETAQRRPQPLTDGEIIRVLAHTDPSTPI